jgi:hypothetical protein
LPIQGGTLCVNSNPRFSFPLSIFFGTIHHKCGRSGLLLLVKFAICVLVRLSKTLNHLQSGHLVSRKAVNFTRSLSRYFTNLSEPDLAIQVYFFILFCDGWFQKRCVFRIILAA